VLTLAPTRELAMQIAGVLEAAGAPLGLTTLCVYGGVPKAPQVGHNPPDSTVKPDCDSTLDVLVAACLGPQAPAAAKQTQQVACQPKGLIISSETSHLGGRLFAY